MKRLAFIIIALLACFGNSYAEDKLQVEEVLIVPGKTAKFNIVLSNPDAQYTAIQADLYLPEGIDLETKGDDYQYELSRVAESHSLDIGKKTGFYRLILSSSKSEVLSGTSGKVISLTVKADASLTEGAKEGSLKSIKLAKVDGSGLVIEQAAYSVTVTQLNVTAPEGKTNLVYSGNAQDLVTAGSTSDGEMQYSLDGTNYGTAIPQGIDAKEYTVYYKVADNLGQNLVDPASFKVTIAAKTVSSPTITLSETNNTYDGQAKEPTVTVKDGETTIPASEYTVSYSNNTNVGTANVTITDKDGGNYTVSGSTTFTISAADGSLTPPSGKSGLVFTGATQDLITAGSSTTGTMQYSLDGTSYNTEIPQGTDAKEYTVYYKVVANAGYNDVAPASFKVTIAAKTVSSPTITLSETSYTYDGTAKEPTVTVKDGGTTIPATEYSVSYSNNTNVGTAIVTITDMEGGNYAVSGSTTFAISSADGSLTPPTGKSDLVYTGAAQDLITAGSSTTGTMQYSLDGTNYSTSIPQGTDAKEYIIYYKVVDNLGQNLVDPASFKVTIAAKTVSSPTITLSETSYTYDGYAKEPTVTVKDGETTIPASEYTVSYSNNTNVGTATITISDKEGGNYAVSGSATFEIKAKEDPVDPTQDETETIKISSAKQVTYMSDKNLDFTTKPELKAYVATGYDKASGTIWLTRVKYVPAKTGFLLMGEASEYEIPVKTGDATSYYMNYFKGTIEGKTIYTNEGDNTNYYLSDGESGVGFYKVQGSVTLKANRAYLSVPTEISAVGTTGNTEMIQVSSAGQVPYYNTESLDFSSLDAQGVKAYTATGYDYNSGTIWLTRVKQVPAETGILIMAPQGEYPVPTASVASVYANMFKGTLTGTTIQTHETIAGEDYINYYLSSGDAGVGFYKVTKEGGVTIGANRCYLPILNKDAAAGTRSANSDVNQIAIEESDEVIGIPLFRGIGGDEDGTTSIREVKSGEVKGEEWYTLQGQRVAKPGKGLYIRNGKKVVIK